MRFESSVIRPKGRQVVTCILRHFGSYPKIRSKVSWSSTHRFKRKFTISKAHVCYWYSLTSFPATDSIAGDRWFRVGIIFLVILYETYNFQLSQTENEAREQKKPQSTKRNGDGDWWGLRRRSMCLYNWRVWEDRKIGANNACKTRVRVLWQSLWGPLPFQDGKSKEKGILKTLWLFVTFVSRTNGI